MKKKNLHGLSKTFGTVNQDDLLLAKLKGCGWSDTVFNIYEKSFKQSETTSESQ